MTTSNSNGDHAIELSATAPAGADPPAAPAPVSEPAMIREDGEALRLVAQLCLCLAPTVTPGSMPPESHKVSFKIHAAASFIAVTLDLLLLVYVILIFSGRVGPHVCAAGKGAMWAALGATYFTFVFGVVIELLG